MSDKATFYPYEEKRPFIQHGDVFATASNALFSKSIRFATRSNVSHVGVFVIHEGRIFVIEAMEGKGVRFMLASKRFKTEKIMLLRGGTFNTRLAYDEIGDEYDLIGALLALIYDTKSAQNFCSEGIKRWFALDFSHLKRGVLPSDIVTEFKVV